MGFNSLPSLSWHRRRIPRSNPATKYNAAYSSFLKIPTELFYMIYQELPFSDALALTFTCSQLYYSAVAAAYIHKHLKSSRAARFEFQCLLEESGIIKGYHCQGCLKRHAMTSFSCEELEKQAKDRYCLHTKKCFCLPPAGEDMSFDDIAEMFDKIDPERSFETRYPFPWTFLLEFEKRIGTTINLVDERHVQTKEDFLALCTRFNFPLCPHLCLNDEKITSRFPPPEWADCLMDNRRDLRCELCKTEAHLVHWGSVLQLHVYRPVGNLKSPRDPVWIAQTFSSRVACLEPARAAATTEMMVHCWGLLSETPLQFEPKNGPFFTPVTLPPQEPKKRVTSLMRRAWGHVRSAVL